MATVAKTKLSTPEVFIKNFTAIDKDKNGKLSQEEINIWCKSEYKESTSVDDDVHKVAPSYMSVAPHSQKDIELNRFTKRPVTTMSFNNLDGINGTLDGGISMDELNKKQERLEAAEKRRNVWHQITNRMGEY